MKKLQFKVDINAASSKVYDIMLGISNKSTYEQWTEIFNPTSTYEGDWSKGSKMLFIGTNEGKLEGMVSEIVENIPNTFLSIRHYGLIKSNIEFTEGPEVERWANGFENYTFDEKNGITSVIVKLDTNDEFLDYMNQAFPIALQKLKEICEQ